MEVKRIALSGLSNTRDLGEIRAENGPRVLERRLIRSGALHRATAADLSVLSEEYRVRTVIDLRMDIETEHEPDPPSADWRCVHLPLLEDSFFGIARDRYSVEAWFNMFRTSEADPAEIFYGMYRKLVFGDRALASYRAFFRILLENEEGAVLWHCSAGKDRAGIAAALTLLALGFPEDVIAYDYEQTAVFTADEIEAVTAIAAARAPGPRMMEAVDVLMSVRPWYIPRLLDEIRSRCGGAEEYFIENHIMTAGELMALRRKYLA